MCMSNSKNIHLEVDAVITSFNQKTMISEAVDSLKSQSIKPKHIIIVDDGSTNHESLSVLHSIENDNDLKIPIKIIYQKNAGVSTARNTGIRNTEALIIVVRQHIFFAEMCLKSAEVMMYLCVLDLKIGISF